MKKTIIFVCTVLAISNAYAQELVNLKNLWSRPDQRGSVLLNKGDAKQAATEFKNPSWRGIANFRAGQYEQAVRDFSHGKTVFDKYNKGNALAYMGEYAKAISVYKEVLKVQPNNRDADYNLKVCEQLLAQRKQQKSKQNEHRKQQANIKNKQQKEKPKGQQANNQPPHPNQQRSQQKNNYKKHQQTRNQWLRRVPDNPGGLLKQKFLRDHYRAQLQKRREQYQ